MVAGSPPRLRRATPCTVSTRGGAEPAGRWHGASCARHTTKRRGLGAQLRAALAAHMGLPPHARAHQGPSTATPTPTSPRPHHCATRAPQAQHTTTNSYRRAPASTLPQTPGRATTGPGTPSTRDAAHSCRRGRRPCNNRCSRIRSRSRGTYLGNHTCGRAQGTAGERHVSCSLELRR